MKYHNYFEYVEDEIGKFQFIGYTCKCCSRKKNIPDCIKRYTCICGVTNIIDKYKKHQVFKDPDYGPSKYIIDKHNYDMSYYNYYIQ